MSTHALSAVGPNTVESQAGPSPNRLKHGLTGTFRVLEFESQEHFEALRDSLRTEHAPATPTELLLVDRLAEHTWLSQRAQRVADNSALDGNDKWFALMLRARATHDRAFHKCLAELRTLRREREQGQPTRSQFEWQSHHFESQKEQFESQNAAAALAESEIEAPAIEPPIDVTAKPTIDWDRHLRFHTQFEQTRSSNRRNTATS